MELEPTEIPGISGRFRTDQAIVIPFWSPMNVYGGYNLNKTREARFQHSVLVNAINSIGVCELSSYYMADWLCAVITDWNLTLPISKHILIYAGFDNMSYIYNAISKSANQEPPNLMRDFFE